MTNQKTQKSSLNDSSKRLFEINGKPLAKNHSFIDVRISQDRTRGFVAGMIKCERGCRERNQPPVTVGGNYPIDKGLHIPAKEFLEMRAILDTAAKAKRMKLDEVTIYVENADLVELLNNEENIYTARYNETLAKLEIKVDIVYIRSRTTKDDGSKMVKSLTKTSLNRYENKNKIKDSIKIQKQIELESRSNSLVGEDDW